MYVTLLGCLWLDLTKHNRRLIIRDDAETASRYVAEYIIGMQM